MGNQRNECRKSWKIRTIIIERVEEVEQQTQKGLGFRKSKNKKEAQKV